MVLAVIAERFFGFELTRRQWVGVLLTAAGLALLAITGDASSGQHSADYSEAAMLIFEGALTALGVALILSCRSDRRNEHTGIVLGAAAGLLFTFTHVAVKALTGKIDTTVAEVFLSPYLWVAVLGGVAAFFASARSLQLGPAVPVIAVTAIAGNASAIPAGIVVFGDPVGSHALHIGVRMLRVPARDRRGGADPRPGPRRGASRRCGGRARRRSTATIAASTGMPQPSTPTSASTKPTTAIVPAALPASTSWYARRSRPRREGGPPDEGESPTGGTLVSRRP